MTTNASMQLGVVGLGRMGANIARRLIRDGHTCVVFDLDPEAVAALEMEGPPVRVRWPTWSKSCLSLVPRG
jgi:6-phosphogluconate dehydrogenase